MVPDLEIETGAAAVRRVVPRAVRAHAFLGAIVVAVLLGGGLRLVSTNTAAAAGSSASGQGAASTACAAR